MSKGIIFLVILLSFSCSVHDRSNIHSNEEFVLELKSPQTRGGLLETALQGLFFGASYLAEKSSKSLSSSYSQSLSVNDYYNLYRGEVEKTYKEIHIKKYSKPIESTDKMRLEEILRADFDRMPKSRGVAGALTINDVIRPEHEDLLNFHAVIALISDPENPGVTRLSFNQLRIFFSKTKIYDDENLNTRISISIEGMWRSTDGSPQKAMLVEQEYNFTDLKYGSENLIKTPILSPWYYDIPITSFIDENIEYGVVKINVKLDEYEGNKSKYINKLPSILSDNKNAIITNGMSALEKIKK